MRSPCWPIGRDESEKQKKVGEGNWRNEEDAKKMKSLNRRALALG